MSFRFGGIKVSEIHFGNKNVTEVYFGINKIYPEQTAITYVIQNVQFRIYSNTMAVSTLGCTEDDYAYIMGTLITYENGEEIERKSVILKPSLAGASTGLEEYFTIDSSTNMIHFNKAKYGKTDLSTIFGDKITTTWVGTSHGVETDRIYLDMYANKVENAENSITLFADSAPANVIKPEGEKLYIYPTYQKTVRTTYTSGYIDDVFQGNVYGTCYIYFKFGGGYEQLWGDDVAVTTGGAAQIYDIPANMFTDQNIRVRIAPSTVEGEDYTDCPDVILNFSQKAMAKHRVIWSIERLSYMMVSMAYDEYEPLPKEVVAGTNLLFYIREIEDCDVTVKQDGVDITGRVITDWEDDGETMSVTVENVQGNLEIILYGYPINPLPIISKFKIDSSSCIACGSCYDTCKFKDAVYKDGLVFAINADKCLGCRECSEPCPVGAIEEYMP